MMQLSRASLIAGAILAFFSTALTAQNFGEEVEKSGTFNRDIYVAGRDVNIQATVNGDVTATGAWINVEGEISGDILASGGIITLRARAHDDIRAAGGEVVLGGEIGDDAVIAGGDVTIERGTKIHGRALLAGGQLNIDGVVEKSLHAVGGVIRINGEISGNAKLIGEHIELAPDAIIRGNLTYRSPNTAVISDTAQILGTTTHESLDIPNPHIFEAGGRIFLALCLFTTAITLFLIFPRFSVAAARYVREAPVQSLGLGFAMLAAMPIGIILLMLTMIGLWLGVMLLALYLLLLLIGYITGILFIADYAIQELRGTRDYHRAWMVASITLVVVVLALLSWMPFVGALATFLLLLLGIGALTASLWRRYTGLKTT